MKAEFTGWYGGEFDDAGLYNTKEEAERGYMPSKQMYVLLRNEFRGKKIKITVEVLED